MPASDLERELRQATLDDAALVADLESMRDPLEPRDPVQLRYWWQMSDELERTMRRVLVREGSAIAYIGVSHEMWSDSERRFGVIRPLLRYEEWTDDDFARLVDIGAGWLRSEGAEAAVARVREDFPRELGVLQRLGFHEDRRLRTSELDLVAHRDRIVAAALESRGRMQERGIAMHPFSDDVDPERYRKLYETMLESGHDVPHSVPEHDMTLDEWRRYWFDNPTIRQDRFWIAREGDDIVGCSVLDCPVVRGVPWTGYTGTRRRVRGRGIARALKYQSMAQAIEVGYKRVRTTNDAENPAILRINHEMGYRLVAPIIELHSAL
ncbi:MAG TPA: GNAT family N-acetyltransferase [Candidatus Dormibacteraeota bacterium]|jgi:RimJ/RimL family protein N-acetyltransferase|nr:GNAT family N-acetyltransferase [Candidatus Dormibacteraeota bacterium]